MVNVGKQMLNYLQNHPIIGSICSIGGATIASFTQVLTSDATVKTVGIMSLYVGFFVGILTGILTLIKIFKEFKTSYEQENNARADQGSGFKAWIRARSTKRGN